MKPSKKTWLRFILYGFLLFATLGIATPRKNIDPAFVDYRRDFIALTKSQCRSFHPGLNDIIEFDELESDVLGYCIHTWLGSTIKIDKVKWEQARPKNQRQLLYHELTHCYLDVRHSEDQTNYMYPYFFSLSSTVIESQLFIYARNFCEK